MLSKTAIIAISAVFVMLVSVYSFSSYEHIKGYDEYLTKLMKANPMSSKVVETKSASSRFVFMYFKN